MLFNSFEFLIFFPIVVAIYFAIPHRFRWILLLIASYYFYMYWKPEYIILIITSTLIDYYAGLQMGKSDDKNKRKKFLLLSIIANLGLLFVFKYFNFTNDILKTTLGFYHINYKVSSLNVLLPVGISFYTFQTMSYTFEVYRGNQKPEKHLGKFALYVSFFPQLVAGPIERSTNLLPQFFKKHNFDYKLATDGLKLMLWGFFKKIVIADRLAILVDNVYDNPFGYNGVVFFIGTIFFAFQIYCDFSGYSDIAIGASQVMGFKLMTNFNRPYFSKSIAEFWKRWHISLSTWFKDYLYISLGGNRVGKWRWYYNLFIVFLISGFWHGANWTFLIWGGLHGFYLIFAIITKDIEKKIIQTIKLDKVPTLLKYLRVFITFCLVCFSWIFFRANSVFDAFYIISHLFSGWNNILSSAGLETILSLGLDSYEFVIAVLSIIFMESVHLIQRHYSVRKMLSNKPIYLRWSIYYAMIFGIILFGKFNEQQFIYFQF